MQQHRFSSTGPTFPPDAIDARRRALALWPRLDAAKLARTCGEPERVARLIERRTSLSREAIVRLLGGRSDQTPREVPAIREHHAETTMPRTLKVKHGQ
jgi:hypothetical protein